MLGRLCEAEVGRECFECFHIIISTNSNNPVFENCDSCKLTPKQSLSFMDEHTEIVLKGFVTSPLSSFCLSGLCGNIQRFDRDPGIDSRSVLHPTVMW